MSIYRDLTGKKIEYLEFISIEVNYIMISWMQRHRKYLVVTIWISTIAFIGAGFVGWGQYNYGDKASAIAKVGDISLTQHSFQQTYSRLYSQYSQLFQGNFDESKAKEFGLQQQALRSLVEGALVLNLAQTYGLTISDTELLEEIKKQPYFLNNGTFDKETYKKVLAQNKITMKEYESDTRNAMLTRKIMQLFNASKPLELENEAALAANSIQDKISYKVLNIDTIHVDVNDDVLKPYWESNKLQFMTLPSYTLEVLKVDITPSNPDASEIQEYYEANKHSFKDAEGKILSLEEAKTALVAALDDKAANKVALKKYLAYKKGELPSDAKIETLTVDASNHTYTPELFNELIALTPENPYLKPRKFENNYLIFKLLSVTKSHPKSFEEAKAEVTQHYIDQEKQKKILQLAETSKTDFSGNTTDFIGIDDVSSISLLEAPQAREFLQKLFQTTNKRGYVTLSDRNVVLYEVLEQKMLSQSLTKTANDVIGTKSMIFDSGLIKLLEGKYPTEIYVKGL